MQIRYLITTPFIGLLEIFVDHLKSSRFDLSQLRFARPSQILDGRLLFHLAPVHLCASACIQALLLLTPEGLQALYSYNAYASGLLFETLGKLAGDEFTRQASPSAE